MQHRLQRFEPQAIETNPQPKAFAGPGSIAKSVTASKGRLRLCLPPADHIHRIWSQTSSTIIIDYSSSNGDEKRCKSGIIGNQCLQASEKFFLACARSARTLRRPISAA